MPKKNVTIRNVALGNSTQQLPNSLSKLLDTKYGLRAANERTSLMTISILFCSILCIKQQILVARILSIIIYYHYSLLKHIRDVPRICAACGAIKLCDDVPQREFVRMQFANDTHEPMTQQYLEVVHSPAFPTRD